MFFTLFRILRVQLTARLATCPQQGLYAQVGMPFTMIQAIAMASDLEDNGQWSHQALQRQVGLPHVNLQYQTLPEHVGTITILA